MQPYVCQLGCQLREYEIEVATRPPGAIPGGSKKLDEAAMVRTFRAFDADASGAVDLAELQAAARTFGVPMSRADAVQVMTSLDKDADGQISRRREGDGVGVHRDIKVFRRFKKINRAYEIRKLADPALSAKEMAEKFDQEVKRQLLRGRA